MFLFGVYIGRHMQNKLVDLPKVLLDDFRFKY
jgi:hypothetical protein